MSAPAGGASGGAPTPPSAPAPTAPGRTAAGLSGGAKAALAIGLAVVIVVAVLALGLVPGVSLFPPSKHAAPALSSSAAMSDAAAVASSHDAGALVYAIGAVSTSTFYLPAEEGNVSCPLTDALDRNLTVPAQTSGYSSGSTNLWLFLYYNSAIPSESLVGVVAGTTYFFGTESGASCLGSISELPISSTAVSSSVAASAADSDAGSFLAVHAEANALYLLVENRTSEPLWAVAYTNCSYNPVTGATSGGTKADLFFAEVNGTTGLVQGEATDLIGSYHCALSTITSTDYELEMTPSGATSSSGSFYDALALAPTSGLTTAMFGLALTTAEETLATTATVPTSCSYGAEFSASSCPAGVGWYGALVGVEGTVIATYGNATAEWGNLAPASSSVALTSGMTLEIVSNTEYAGSGALISAFSTGSAAVSGSALL